MGRGARVTPWIYLAGATGGLERRVAWGFGGSVTRPAERGKNPEHGPTPSFSPKTPKLFNGAVHDRTPATTQPATVLPRDNVTAARRPPLALRVMSELER